MKTLIANKGTLVSIIVFIMVIFLYNLFKSETVSVPNELSASNIGNDLLKIHRELQRVTFDQTLFSSPSYLGLIDFSVSIPQQVVGRPNPFDVIGRD